ncbi:MAG: helicase protein [Parcubacteria group bacterium GW2011_GWD2_42_14]|nr:MAG: helicase protein [Parcubacteria group bacterium GW2011_GWD2_42_14]
MFGSRNEYLKYFELSIPENLYLDWHKCFIFHRLSLQSIRSGSAPVWMEDKRVSVAASASIDKATVSIDSGEMGFEIFDFNKNVLDVINDHLSDIEKLEKLQTVLGKTGLPNHLVDFIKGFSPEGSRSLAVHSPFNISNYSDADQELIKRTRGFIGSTERAKYPDAIHHIRIFHNSNEKARLYYRYVNGSIKFLKNLK